MTLWHITADELEEIERDNRGKLTVDQQLKVCEIRALLMIGQELSVIHHEGINPDYSAGTD